MNWFDTSGLTSLAKSALKEAQKTIDKALDIEDDSDDEQGDSKSDEKSIDSSQAGSSTNNDQSDFFASWGLTMSAESREDAVEEPTVVTKSPAKTASTLWGSFTSTLADQTNKDAIVRPPKAKSMNLIEDSTLGSQDDLFSKSQLVLSDEHESNVDNDERRSSTRSAGLSLISSKNSSESVEVLSQSLKSTPESEPPSAHSSQSSERKPNSESVEVLPDSLLSPNSIECIGFDSYGSDKNSSPSSNIISPISDKSTPLGDIADIYDKTADSVSLVHEDDEDTISYNSISECTVPTVFDNEDKTQQNVKTTRVDSQKKMQSDLEQAIHKMQISENSSNDGSWSDRTLNADNESVLDATIEEQKKDVEEELMMEKLSDSSSFYNVCVTTSSATSEIYVNLDKTSETKDKERISPSSSDSKSDLVKIGSERTSGHTSGDEIETTTSSDIEIIPSPNGDGCRNSPAKYAKQSKDSQNLVDMVLGKALATKVRGHNRELSETSVQSNTSDESQGSENDRLMRRLCEMAEVLEAKESKLVEVSRNNVVLLESNADLKSQLDSILSKHQVGDINVLTDDYTQRMSALEKKFQQAIREKDQLRKQLDSINTKSNSEFESSMKEKDDMISQLQVEGEKLSRQQLQHSNIIKKLRAKEKDNEQVIKNLRDKIAEQTNELDRCKRSIAAKEEIEVSHIEAVYRLTTANKKMETELLETRVAYEDIAEKLESIRVSYESAKSELSSAQRLTAEFAKNKEENEALQREKDSALEEAHRLKAQVQQLRSEMVEEQRRWWSREESLRREVNESRALAESPGFGLSEGLNDSVATLLTQLATLQRSALERDNAHEHTLNKMRNKLSDAEMALIKAKEQERFCREENLALQQQLSNSQSQLEVAQSQLQQVTNHCQEYLHNMQNAEQILHSKCQEYDSTIVELRSEISSLKTRLEETETQLQQEKEALDITKKKNSLLQEQLMSRPDMSPPHSVLSDSLSNSLWGQDDMSEPMALMHSYVGERLQECARTVRSEHKSHREEINLLEQQRKSLAKALAEAEAKLDHFQNTQEQYDALLQMYGEKEEQLVEVKLDLQDVTHLYKAQLDELIALKQQLANR